jgi:regulator of protease activity HflC (stomatin/prohibitin superfamily)
MSHVVRAEQPYRSANGYLMVLLGVALVGLGVFAFTRGVATNLPGLLFALGLIAVGVALLAGLYMLQPNTAAILLLFGERKLSLRARNLNMPTLKVNDKRGNPIEIAAAVVWRVRDTAQAVFEVDDYELFVKVQAEAALRYVASQHAYDHGEDANAGETTLRGSIDEVAAALKNELQARFADAGVEVLDAKLTHLAYAPEIAQVMLRRQQAEAIISARTKIVQGAVSMVEAALKGLSEREIVHLDDERKAAMVSNLLVVLCSDKDTQPILNAGTLYN